MADYTQDSYYVLSLNILKALGGDVTVPYPDADAIWDAIYEIYDYAGGRFDIVPLEKTITENGQYDYYPEGGADAFMPVNIKVDVPQKYTDEQVESLVAEATLNGYNDGYVEGEVAGKETGYEEGYTSGTENGISIQKDRLIDIEITQNGTYTREDGYENITVTVDAGISDEELAEIIKNATDEGYTDGYAEGLEDGAEDQKALLETLTVSENGTYNREDGWNSVTVQVAGSGGSAKPKIYNGFVLNSTSTTDTAYASDLAEVDFSQYDWSSVYDLSYFFQNFGNNSYFSDSDFDNFNEHFNGKIMSCKCMFNPASGSYGALREVPSFLNNRMHDCVDASCMFQNNVNLVSTNNIQNWDTHNVITCEYMFAGCNKLTSVPLFDTSNVVNMDNMFYGCSKLTSIPQFDTSNVTTMYNMCNSCLVLTSIPLLDCGSICTGSNVDICGTGSMSKLTDLGGFKDLGKVSGFSKPSYFLKNCPNLTKESVMNVINNLYDRATAGYSVVTLPFNSASLALLSDEDIAIATNKGWTLA